MLLFGVLKVKMVQVLVAQYFAKLDPRITLLGYLWLNFDGGAGLLSTGFLTICHGQGIVVLR